MFSAFKPFLVTIAMISFLIIIGNFLSLQTGVYGSVSISRNKTVRMLSYIDDKNNNQWRSVTDFTDSGKWFSSSPDNIFHSAHCGYPKDYVITKSGPVASFRSDGVREIQPPSN